MAGGLDYRRHWHEPAFWRWYWRERVPIGGKILVVLLGVALLAGGGYAAETALPASAASSGNDSNVLTIVRTYTVRQPGHVKERVVVRHLTTPGRVSRSTEYLTQTVASPAETVLRTLPEVQTHVVTVAGRAHTTTVVRRTTTPGKTQTVSTTVPTTEVQTTTVTVTKSRDGGTTTKTVTTTTTVPTTVTETTTVHRTTTVTTTEPGTVPVP